MPFLERCQGVAPSPLRLLPEAVQHEQREHAEYEQQQQPRDSKAVKGHSYHCRDRHAEQFSAGICQQRQPAYDGPPSSKKP
ncbi:hypothetical protein ACFTAO_51160 [Paenibacillus rhizoplanae]